MPLTPGPGARTPGRASPGARTPGRATTARKVARVLALAAALAFTAILALPGTVAAHADLVASSPSDRAVVVGEPHQLTLVFSERVTLALSSVTVIAPSGHRVDRTISAVAGSGGERIRVQLAREEPGHGTFVATWRATAADDGHTTSGAVTFSVGAPGGTARAAGGTGGTGGQNRLTDAVLDVAIWLGFAGLAGMVGFAAVRLYCLPESGGGGGGDADHSSRHPPGYGARRRASGRRSGRATSAGRGRGRGRRRGRGHGHGLGRGRGRAGGRRSRSAFLGPRTVARHRRVGGTPGRNPDPASSSTGPPPRASP